MSSHRLVLVLTGLLIAALACALPGTAGPYNGGPTSEFPTDSPETENARLADATATAELAGQMTEAAGSALRLTQTAAAELPLAATATPAEGPFKNAVLTFDVANTTFTGAAKGGVAGGCWPPNYYDSGAGYLRVAEDGTLDGKCTYDVEWHSEGALTGRLDRATGQVNFHLEATQIIQAPDNTGTGTNTYTVDGVGQLVDNAASGIAIFTFICTAQGEGVKCAGEPSLTTSGTVPFTLTFSP